MPSDAGGPDYQDVILARGDSSIVRGDLELHVRASDWYRHGHHRDPRYNRVVLHVVWIDDGEQTMRADGERVPVLTLQDWCSAPAADGLVPHPCVAAFARLSGEAVRERVRAAGAQRFEQRSERFAAEMTYLDPDEVAYTALLEAMGHASNRQAFRDLAQAAPFGWLWSLPADVRLAALLDAAGLAPGSAHSAPARLPAASWRLDRLRPANHPLRRLRGVELLLRRFGPNLADALLDAVLHSTSPAALRAHLVVSDGSGTYIGAGRADEMAASAVLPFTAAHPETDDARCFDLYLRYPSPPSTRWTRVMRDLLARAGHDFRPRTAPEHQGLHFLYHHFCRREGAPGCPVCSTNHEP